MITLIGDVHGHFESLREILTVGSGEFIQLGDLGLGFPIRDPYERETKGLITNFHTDKDFKFIRGNHDDPKVCRAHPNYAGDFGVLDNGIFFLGGAFSVDRAWRRSGIDWWPEEELNFGDMDKALSLYLKTKPKIVLTHMPPECIVSKMHPLSAEPCRTSQLLQSMFDHHKPEKWFYGHHHMNWTKVYQGCYFLCLDSLKTYELKV